MSTSKSKTQDHHNHNSNGLLDAQKKEILKREVDFQAGRIKAESWEEVRKRFIK